MASNQNLPGSGLFQSEAGSRQRIRGRSIFLLRRIAVGFTGGTVILAGVAMLILPGTGLVTIALGLAILATEFGWARAWLRRARDEIARRNPLKR